MKERIESKSKALDKIKDEIIPKGKNTPASRKKKHLRKELQTLQRDLASSKLPSSVILFAGMFAVHHFLKGQVGGEVVAILPFEPFPLLTKMTQRGLEGISDPTAASMTCVYLLSNLLIRGALQRFLSFGVNAPNMGIMEQAGWQGFYFW